MIEHKIRSRKFRII